MENYGFIYIWRDRKYNKYYIGSHWGYKDDKYICSSQNMRVNKKHRPEDFKRRIISIITTNRVDLLKEEQRWLDMIKIYEFGYKYYNINARATDYAWWMNEETKRIVGEKLSVANKRRMADRTCPFANNEFQVAMSKKAHSDPNHPFHGGLCDELQKRVDEGTHHFQGGKIQKETQLQKVKDGTHNFAGKAPWNKSKKGVMPEPWNKGLTKETNEKLRNTKSGRPKGGVPWNKGKKGVQIAWNKGLINKRKEEKDNYFGPTRSECFFIAPKE